MYASIVYQFQAGQMELLPWPAWSLASSHYDLRHSSCSQRTEEGKMVDFYTKGDLEKLL